jgi:putative restriction endonuclease
MEAARRPCEIPNGLALCAIHHKAFDKGSIGLDEDMRIQVSPAVNGGASLAGCSGILMVSRLPCRRGKHAIRRKGLWRGTGGRCSGGEGDGV